MTVTFPLKDAKDIVAKYQWLIGKPINTIKNEYPIKYIVIAPADTSLFNKFIDHFYFQYPHNNEESLQYAGYDSEKVRILVMEENPDKGAVIYEELDTYLTKNNIKKEYSLRLQ